MTVKDFTVGIDIGGTHVRVGAVTADGRIAARRDADTPAGGDPERLGTLLRDSVRRITNELGPPVVPIGVALPGLRDPATGILQRALNLPELQGIDVREYLAGAIGHAVFVESDVNAAGWAQWHHLDWRPARFVYLSLGTGVGGSVILDGRLVRHTRGGAGHFGFLVVDTAPDAPVDAAGVPGCLSAVAAGPVLTRAAAPTADAEPTAAATVPSAVLDQAASGLAVALANVAHLYAPDCIALGGGVIDHHPSLVDRTCDALRRYRSALLPAGLRVQRAALSSDGAGVIGAALLARQSA